MAHGLASSLRRARREPSAFGGFYASQSRQLLALFVRRTFDVEVARDLTAETFAQAFEHRRRFRGSTDAEASGWLYGIARHQLSRYGRNGKVERKALERLGVQVPTVSAEDYDHIALEPREGPAGWRSVMAVPDGGEIALWQSKRWVPGGEDPGAALPAN
jgi:DNA-directed RNA polymerase specialized sigma24 family protein